MRIVSVMLLTVGMSILAGPAAMGKTKGEAPHADEAFATALDAYVSKSFPDATSEDHAAIHSCILGLFADVTADHKALLVDTAFFNDEPQRLGEVLQHYPAIVQDLPGCLPETAVATNRNVRISNGSLSLSVRIGGSGSFPNHAGGVFYDNGELRVAGELVPLPDFKRQLIVRISDSGEVSFDIDP